MPALQAALIEGEESGEPVPFESERFLARMHAKHAGYALSAEPPNANTGVMI